MGSYQACGWGRGQTRLEGNGLQDRDRRSRAQTVREPGDVGIGEANTAVGRSGAERAGQANEAVQSDLAGTAIELLVYVGVGGGRQRPRPRDNAVALIQLLG